MDTAFFVASKLLGALIRPDTWIVLLHVLILWALLTHRRNLAVSTASLALALLLALTIFPVGNLLLQPIELIHPAQPKLNRVDGIIVLGGGEDARASAYWGGLQLNEGGDRYTAALSLARRFPKARLLFAGGSGALRGLAGGVATEAAAAGRFFTESGIAQERLLLEDRSRNTSENARRSFEIAKPAVGETWVLVTSAFHVSRALQSFEEAGWTELVPWPVDYRTSSFADGIGWDLSHNLQVLTTALREQTGRLVYGLTSR